MIARVFPRKTAMSPTDDLAFFGEPTLENIADCMRKGVGEVHISVTFTWDLQRAEDLYYAWQILGVPVEVGGPAFDDRMGDFTPGLYLREGMIFTSRGCTKDAGSAPFRAVHTARSRNSRFMTAGTSWTITSLQPARNIFARYVKCSNARSREQCFQEDWNRRCCSNGKQTYCGKSILRGFTQPTTPKTI